MLEITIEDLLECLGIKNFPLKEDVEDLLPAMKCESFNCISYMHGCTRSRASPFVNYVSVI